MHKTMYTHSYRHLSSEQAEQYERDFQEERRDREKAMQRLDDEQAKNAVDVQVTKDEIARLKGESRLKDELFLEVKTSHEIEVERQSREIASLQEEVQAKTAQVKQYKKQIDSLQQGHSIGQQQCQMLQKKLDSTMDQLDVGLA